MFNMLGPNVPLRPRNRLQHRRGLGGQIRQRADGISNDMWMPVANGRMWPPIKFGGNRPPMPNRFEDILGPPLPRFMSPYDLRYEQNGGDPYAQAMPRHARARKLPMTFAKAIQSLSDELDSAVKYCREVEKQFSGETYDVAVWADTQSLDLLWAKKLSWNGVLAFEYARDSGLKPPSTVVTYNMVVESLHDAFDNVGRSPLPSATDITSLENSHVTPESFVTTMNKLDASFEGIEELLEIVRRHRDRMPALCRELTSAHKLLGDIREVWAPRKKPVRQQRVRDEFAWGEYGLE